MIGSLLRRIAHAGGYSFQLEFPALLQAPQSRLALNPAWLLSALAERPGPVTFIQVGANDGLHADPVRAHVLARHWRGLLLEPDVAHFAKLQQNYRDEPQLRFLNAAVGTGADMDYFYLDSTLPNPPDWAVGLGSFVKATLLGHAAAIPSLESHVRVRKIPTITANRMFELFAEPHVDLLVTDVEGYDAEIIQSIDFHRWRPGCIFYESKHLCRARHDALLRHLIAAGYLVAPGGSDSVALRPDFA